MNNFVWPLGQVEHIGITVALLAAGAFFWLFDGFLAERADIEMKHNIVDNAFGLERRLHPEDHNERRLQNERSIRTLGKVLLAAGVLVGATLLLRLAA